MKVDPKVAKKFFDSDSVDQSGDRKMSMNMNDSVSGQYLNEMSFGKRMLLYGTVLGTLAGAIWGIGYFTQDKNQEYLQTQVSKMEEGADKVRTLENSVNGASTSDRKYDPASSN